MSLCRPPETPPSPASGFRPRALRKRQLTFRPVRTHGGPASPRAPETARGTTPPATRTVFFPRFSSCRLPLPFSPIPPTHSPPLIACRRWFSGRPFFPAPRPPGTGRAD